MIFYFTGTGNSFAAAKALLKKDEKLVSVGEAIRNRSYTYHIQEDETIGFVFPVYYAGLPTAVEWFVRKMHLTGGRAGFTYAVLTCGSSPGGTDAALRKLLAEKEISLDQCYRLIMPENYFIMFSMPSEEEQNRILEDADKALQMIRLDIGAGPAAPADECECCTGHDHKENESVPEEQSPEELLDGISACTYRSNAAVRAASVPIHAVYTSGLVRKTEPFWVDDQCVSCHACEKRCPCGAITLIGGVPTWLKETCVMCLGCARCGAIHYGNADAKNGRYKHPVFRKKTAHQH